MPLDKSLIEDKCDLKITFVDAVWTVRGQASSRFSGNGSGNGEAAMQP